MVHLPYNVKDPCPSRRLKGVISVPRRSKLFCRHQYIRAGFHEGTIVNCYGETVRTAIRHYECEKCNRLVFVLAETDIDCISKASKRRRVE